MEQALLHKHGQFILKAPVNVSLVDTQGAFLDAAKSNVQHQKPEADVRSAKMPIEVFFDKVNSKDNDGLLIISMGYVWNEIQKNPKARAKALKWIQSHMPFLWFFTFMNLRTNSLQEMLWK